MTLKFIISYYLPNAVSAEYCANPNELVEYEKLNRQIRSDDESSMRSLNLFRLLIASFKFVNPHIPRVLAALFSANDADHSNYPI